MIKLTTTKQSSKYVKVLCYGDAGVGKTMLCATAPSPIIISAESGLLSLSHLDIPVIEVKTIIDVQEAFQFLTESKEAEQFETICLDSVTEIAEVLLTQYKHEEKDPRAAYGRLADSMSTLVRSFRDLPDKHVYFSAKMTRIEDDHSGISTFRPLMPGKTLTTGLPFFFDEVLALRIGELDNGDQYRYLQTQPDLQYIAKDRSGKLDAVEQPDLSILFEKMLNSDEKHLDKTYSTSASSKNTDQSKEIEKEDTVESENKDELKIT